MMMSGNLKALVVLAMLSLPCGMDSLSFCKYIVGKDSTQNSEIVEACLRNYLPNEELEKADDCIPRVFGSDMNLAKYIKNMCDRNDYKREQMYSCMTQISDPQPVQYEMRQALKCVINDLNIPDSLLSEK